ncbi:hypothetical protein ANCCEY_04135 [Ancylostoma ceylanicum]|uniref:E1 domain-containing protein n=1 Tax=Ancylostoma ceylanicum TaxID=53326 RepID=A0A0D6M013_9BILA|nr:hypothetical protein ANCCEY_04135 [Ancylostoma ceylanicum]
MTKIAVWGAREFFHAYPKLNITNIVEYSHEVAIEKWCREEGTPCKWTHTVRPYQCIDTVNQDDRFASNPGSPEKFCEHFMTEAGNLEPSQLEGFANVYLWLDEM